MTPKGRDMTDKIKVDAASAAAMYQEALERIAKAPSLATAVREARRALRVQYEKPKQGHISVAGYFGHRTQQPLITLETTQKVTQMDAATARKIALDILTQADYAEQDGGLSIYLADELKLNPQEVGAIIGRLRAFRARFRPDLVGLGLADDEDPPPAPNAA